MQLKMGKVMSSLKHPFRNFNVESRAHKVIAQEKPKAAPRHPREQLDYERLMKDYPEVYEESLKKNPQLDQHLKDVFVKSFDTNKKIENDPSKPLPTDKSQVTPFLFGFKEPDKIPLGKTTLRQALQFITDHQTDPNTFTPKKIAEDYLLPEETVRNIIKYYRVFEVYIPKERKTKAKFAGPSIPKVQIIKEPRKELPKVKESDKKNDT